MLQDVGSPGEPKALAFLFSRAEFYLLVIYLFIIQNGGVFHNCVVVRNLLSNSWIYFSF